MARWQLQCSGKSEEDHCKFCQSELPNWRGALFKDMIDSSDDDENNVGANSQDNTVFDVDGVTHTFPVDTMGVTGGSSNTHSFPVDTIGVTGSGAGAGDGDVQRRSDTSGVTNADGAGGGSTRSTQATTTPSNSRRSSNSRQSLDEKDVKGDIIVKFNDMSFRCKVRTGQEGLEDFMAQIREKCGIPEEKMQCLNLTYRCKDPNTGSQMTLQGVNESAFDAAVLCSAAQDKIKQRRKAQQGGGCLGSGCDGKSSSGDKTPVSTASNRSPTTRQKSSDAPGSPDGKSARLGDDMASDATTERANRRHSVDRVWGGSGGSSGSDQEMYNGGSGSGLSSDGDDLHVNSPDASPPNTERGVRSFKRGARRLSAPPPSTASFEDQTQTQNRKARRPWPSFMRAFSSK